MLYLREVTCDDLQLIFDWANDPETRKNSFHTEQISFQEHERWFHRMLESETVKQYVLIDDCIDVGQIRINISHTEAEISYSIAPQYRGKGYGKQIVLLLIQKVKTEMPEITTLTAEVKPENLRSQKVFERENFALKSLKYELDLGAF